MSSINVSTERVGIIQNFCFGFADYLLFDLINYSMSKSHDCAGVSLCISLLVPTDMSMNMT